MRIVADRDIPHARTAFSKFGEVELAAGRSLSRDRLGDAQILLVRSVTRVDHRLLDGTDIRFVGTATSGVDHLDTEYLNLRKIPYFSAAGCNARAVAEYVLACGFLHGPLGSRGSSSVRAGIVGYGNVGKIVCSMLTSLGVHCVVNDPPLADSSPDVSFVELDEALDSDIVSLHVPLTEAGDFPTRHLIGAKQLSRLRPDTLLINTARGGIIDEDALLGWLRERGRAPVAIDCWVAEPTVRLPLLRLATIATPHIAGHTIEARRRATAILVRKLEAILGTEADFPSQFEVPIDFKLDQASPEPVRTAVLHCCNPSAVTAMMRRVLGFPITRRAGYFDQLRNQAAIRREFPAVRIASEGLQSDTVAMLRELGFEMTTQGTENDATE